MTEQGFRRPLGLVLSGGGSLAAWQAGCLHSLIQGGLVFDHVLGFSSGALNGALYSLGMYDELLSRWRRIDEYRAMRFAPSWKNWCLFSGDPIRAAVDFAHDEQAARKNIRCVFTVISLCADDGMPVYARFSPAGKGAWDSPFATWLAASCPIPRVFPKVTVEVRGEIRHMVDGGIPGREWMRFDALAGCKDVIVLELVRPDEIGLRWWNPFARYEQNCREVIRRQINSGVDSLQRLPDSPSIFRVTPSKRLNYYELSFKADHCVPAIELGQADGSSFLNAGQH